jgi:ATP synthase protein I
VTGHDDDRRRFGRTVGRKADRRIEARRRNDDVWFWLGMLGLVGWSVAIPTVAGVALGLWLDRVAPARFSWVLTMLVVGLTLGLLNAWMWVSRESEGEPNDSERTAGPNATEEDAP